MNKQNINHMQMDIINIRKDAYRFITKQTITKKIDKYNEKKNLEVQNHKGLLSAQSMSSKPAIWEVMRRYTSNSGVLLKSPVKINDTCLLGYC